MKRKKIILRMIAAGLFTIAMFSMLADFDLSNIQNKFINEPAVKDECLDIESIVKEFKMDSMEINMTCSSTVEVHNKSYFGLKFKEKITRRETKITKKYKIIYNYDFNNIEISNKEGTYIIKLSVDDIKKELVTNDTDLKILKKSFDGIEVDAESINKASKDMDKKCLDSSDKYKDKAIVYTKENLENFLKKLDVKFVVEVQYE